MKNKFMAAAAIVAILTATGAASADEITNLKAQSVALKKQNAALEKRLNKLEKRQAAEEKKIQQKQAAQPSVAPDSFVGMVTKGPLDVINDEGPITWHGITIFGTFDIGAGWASHGAPVNSDLYFGNVAVNGANRGAYFGVVPSGLSQTTLGIKGEEQLLPGLAGVFYASTGINPQSGQLANAPGSQAANNGLTGGANGNQSLNADGTRGGQAFNDELYAGLASKTFGQLTFGRQKTLENEVMVGKYDPAGGSYNYSLIGLSGKPVAGGGVTDDGRIDDTLKYKVEYGPIHFGALYKFIDGSAGAGKTADNDGYQFDLGGNFGGFGLDVVGGHFNQAITYGALNGCQYFGTGCTAPATIVPNANNTLAGKAYDTSDVSVGANYTWNQFKFFAGYAYDLYHNAKDPIGVGANTGQGDYYVSVVSSTGITTVPMVLQTEWAGVKYAYNSNLDFTLSYYHEGQNNYSAGSKTCSNSIQNTRSGACSGEEHYVSLYGDYHFTKRFDVYAGLTSSVVTGGMASGYIKGTATDWAPTAGVRFKF